MRSPFHCPHCSHREWRNSKSEFSTSYLHFSSAATCCVSPFHSGFLLFWALHFRSTWSWIRSCWSAFSKCKRSWRRTMHTEPMRSRGLSRQSWKVWSSLANRPSEISGCWTICLGSRSRTWTIFRPRPSAPTFGVKRTTKGSSRKKR